MKNQMMLYLINTLVGTFLRGLDPGQLKIALDKFIDAIEDTIEASPNKVDDAILPGLRFCRELFDIPDLPDENGVK